MAESMKVGLLWFDDDAKRPFSQKVELASQRYLQKFGVKPDTCYVNPETLPSNDSTVNGIRIVPTQFILPNHYWVGVSEN